MNSISPILSIIVIVHEQREQLRRCIDSILAMNILYPSEIIISDDRSTDGSYELAKEYANDNYPKPKNINCIVAIQCNSDECSPAYNSDRSGYNRCNAYLYARGKYIVHVDADDYFLPNANVYNKQIKMLEQHPECYLAMSDYLYIHEGQNISEAIKVTPMPDIKSGEILSSITFIQDVYFHLNQAFMLRRNSSVNPVKLYGKKYVDSVITYHHLQFGPIVYVDACDYVYVQYQKSVTGQMEKFNEDKQIMWCLSIYIPCLIPKWRNVFIKSHYNSIRSVIRLAKNNYSLQPHNYMALCKFNMWIYDCFGHQITLYDKIRIRVAMYFQRVQKKMNWYGSLCCNIMWNLLK